MSTVKSNNVQVGQSLTATNNFTLYQPASPDGTVRLGVGNAGATTSDVLTVSSTGLQILGSPAPRMVLDTAKASTSGTAIDFTGIPSWVKRITVMFSGVSTNGTNNWLIQIGSGSVDATGYNSASARTGSTTLSTTAYTTGFGINSTLAANVIGGSVSLTNLSGNIWCAQGVLADQVSANTYTVGGNKSLSGVLDRIRITTGGGTDTFDAGTINILYEG